MKSLMPCGLVVITLILTVAVTQAQLAVKVDEPKRTGDKAVIELTLKNTFTEKIESARATVFLVDDQGKVVGQSAQWVIGGTKDRPTLAPDAATTFNFVVPTAKLFTKTKVIFNRLVLDGGKSVDVNQNIHIEQ